MLVLVNFEVNWVEETLASLGSQGEVGVLSVWVLICVGNCSLRRFISLEEVTDHEVLAALDFPKACTLVGSIHVWFSIHLSHG